MVYLALASRCLVGIVFAAAAISKLRSRKAYREFVSWHDGLPLWGVRGRWIAAPMAGIEAAIVILMAVPWTASVGLALAAAALAVFAVAALFVVRTGVQAPCRCFGASTAPLSVRHVARDAGLSVVAGVGAAGVGSGSLRPAGAALCVGAAVVAAALVLFLDDLAVLFATGMGAAVAPPVRPPHPGRSGNVNWSGDV